MAGSTAHKNIEYLISMKLFEHDPAHTYCVINEMYTEYDSEAKLICDLIIGHKKKLRESMEEVFEKQFKGLYDINAFNNAYDEIDKELS